MEFLLEGFCAVSFALNFFGLPALRRYQEKEVVVIISTDSQSSLPAPAVTVCPQNPNTTNGFPINEANFSLDESKSRIGEVCKEKEGKNIAQCVDSATYNLSSAVGNLKLPGMIFVGVDDLPNMWAPDFTHTKGGKCFTPRSVYNFTQLTSPEDVFMIGFKPNTDYNVFLNDPTISMINYNPLVPITRMIIEKDELVSRAVLIIQHHNLNIPSKPCSLSPSYTFTACVKTFLFQDVGCRLPWDTWTDTVWPLCHTLEQYRCTRQTRLN